MDVRRRASSLACVSLFVFPLFVVLLVPAVARAADPVEKVTALNKKALDEYKKRDYDSARALLKEALEICNSSGLDTHPIKARTHIHLGIVSIVGFKERDLGIKHFRKALDIQPDIKLTKQLATKDLQDAFEEAALAGGEGGGAASAGGGQAADEGGASEGGGAPAAQGDEDEEGASKRPARPRRPPPKKKRAADGDEGGGEGGGDEDGEGDGAPYHLYIGIQAGIGAGLASGKADIDPNMHQLGGAGFALAQAFQISPEIGYFFSPTLMISARLRYQIVTGVTGKPSAGCSGGFCDPTTFAVAGMVRASIFLGTGSTRFFVGGEIGGGYITHVVSFPMDSTCKTSGTASSNVKCVDSLSGGPVILGGVAGLLFDLGKAAGLVLTVVPDLTFPKFTLNFDIQGGLALHF
jgi:Tetratricopeptide repeat